MESNGAFGLMRRVIRTVKFSGMCWESIQDKRPPEKPTYCNNNEYLEAQPLHGCIQHMGGTMTLKTLVLLSMIAVVLLTWKANGYIP